MRTFQNMVHACFGMLVATAVSVSVAAEPRKYFVVEAAVFAEDPAVFDVEVESPSFEFHKLRPVDRERQLRELGKVPARSTLLFTGWVFSPSSGVVPQLSSVTVHWKSRAEEGAQAATLEAVVPLSDYASAHNFLHSQLLLTVRPTGLLVELFEDRENGAAQFFRCFGSSFSASGACGLRRTVVTLGTYAGRPASGADAK